MKLNPECVRDILLEIEKVSLYGKMYFYDGENLSEDSYLAKYDFDTVIYHIRQCSWIGYLVGVKWGISDGVYIEDLSPEGHVFLANIRSNNIWSKVKDIGKRIGSVSIPVLSEIASSVLSEYIQSAIKSSVSP